MYKYSVVIQWSDDDKAYVATVPELPGLSALGGTRAKAVKELSIAQKLYCAALAESGSLPEPEKMVTFSGQIRVRLPKSLHASLRHEAKKEGVSLNTYIVKLLSEKNTLERIENKIDKIEADNRRMEKLELVIRADAPSFVAEALNNPWADKKWETQITPIPN